MSAVPIAQPSTLPTPPRRIELASPVVVRLARVSAVALFVAVQWGGLERPAAGGPMVLCAALAVAAAVVSLIARRPGSRAGRAVALAAPVVAFLVALPVAGVSRHLLVPAGWGEL